MTNEIHTCLESLTLGKPAQAQNLSVFPLRDRSNAASERYLTMDLALKEGLLRVTEIDASGSVPELRVHNLAGKPVLLLDGEELVGALQNRVLNVTILVPPKTDMVVPVSCVEMGRWSFRSSHFQGGGRAMYARGRAEKIDQVNQSLRARGSRRSDQHAVWRDIERKAEAMDVCCRTSAMADIYLGTHERRQEYRELDCPENARGAIFCNNGQPVGLEVVDSAATFKILFPKLLDSYALDALETPVREPALPDPAAVQSLINAAGAANVERFPALGMGEDVRVESANIVGGGLAVEDQLVQLSAFWRSTGPGHRGPRDHYFNRFLRGQRLRYTETDDLEASRRFINRFLLEED